MNKPFETHFIPVAKDVIFNPYICEFKFVQEEIKKEDSKPALKRKQKVLGLSLVLGYHCNMRCIYCYARGGERSEVMGLDLLTAALYALKGETLKRGINRIRIGFTGGEPSLYELHLRKAVHIARSLFGDDNVIFIINTNGVFKEEFIDFLKENKFYIQISYDGFAFQNLQRPLANGSRSRDIVLRNLSKIIEERIPIEVRVTVTKYNISSMPEIIKELANYGVKYVRFDPVYEAGRAYGKGLSVEQQEFIRNFIEAVKIGLRKEVLVTTGLLMILCNPSEYMCAAMHMNEYIVLPDGNLSACYFVTSPEDKFADIFIYGRVNKKRNMFEYNYNKVNILSKYKVSNIRFCKRCLYRYVCGAACPIYHDMFRKSEINSVYDIFRIEPRFCKFMKALISGYLRAIYEGSQ